MHLHLIHSPTPLCTPHYCGPQLHITLLPRLTGSWSFQFPQPLASSNPKFLLILHPGATTPVGPPMLHHWKGGSEIRLAKRPLQRRSCEQRHKHVDAWCIARALKCVVDCGPQHLPLLIDALDLQAADSILSWMPGRHISTASVPTVQRRSPTTTDEPNLILHTASGQLSGIFNKLL